MRKTFFRLFMLMALPMLLGLASCSNEDDNPASYDGSTDETLVDKVWAFSQTHPDGFTLDIRTMTEPSEGIAVSYAATQGSHSKESLSLVTDHALAHDGYVGGWLDTDTGLYYFDSTRLFPEDQRDEAIAFRRDNGQRSLYVISTGEEIWLDEPREYASIKEALEGIPGASIVAEDEQAGKYVLSFTQSIDHTGSSAGIFTQRVSVLFRGFDRPVIMVTEGYDWGGTTYDVTGFGTELDANVVRVEHRNYGESCNSDLGAWKHQTIAQASADLHCVFQALKAFLPGKWMSYGGSKSGETSIDYQYFYPQDMDLAVAFCAPFMTSLSDRRFGDYLFETCGTAEERETMTSGIRKYLADGEEGLYKAVRDSFPDLSWSEYVFNVFDAYFQAFQTTTQAALPSMQEVLGEDEFMAYNVSETIKYNHDPEARTYFIDAILEQGFPYNGYDRFSDLLDGTSFSEENVLRSFLSEDEYWIVDAYDNSVRRDMAENFFPSSTRPFLLVYSLNDPWSAGAPDPDRLSPAGKMIVNPVGIHSGNINREDYYPEEIRSEILSYVKAHILCD